MAKKLPAVLDDVYTEDQAKEAVTFISQYRRRTGDYTNDNIPKWMVEARRQYNRNNQRKLVAERRAAAGAPRRSINSSLTEDGIIDWMAVEMVVSGTRSPKLTRKEKVLAYAYMTENMGLNPVAALERLNQARTGRLTQSVQEGEHKDILAAIERGDMKTSGDPLKF